MLRRLLYLAALVVVVIAVAASLFVYLAFGTMGDGRGWLTIVVQVVDASGEPVPGAEVSLWAAEAGETRYEWREMRSAETGESGVATLTDRFEFGGSASRIGGRSRTFVTAMHSIKCVADGFRLYEQRLGEPPMPRFDEDEGPPYVLPILIHLERDVDEDWEG